MADLLLNLQDTPVADILRHWRWAYPLVIHGPSRRRRAAVWGDRAPGSAPAGPMVDDAPRAAGPGLGPGGRERPGAGVAHRPGVVPRRSSALWPFGVIPIQTGLDQPGGFSCVLGSPKPRLDHRSDEPNRAGGAFTVGWIDLADAVVQRSALWATDRLCLREASIRCCGTFVGDLGVEGGNDQEKGCPFGF